MTTNTSRTAVANTNSAAVLSKLSMTRRMYATDPFLEYFVADKDSLRTRSPLIHRFYYLSFKAIEYALNGSQDIQLVISFGCVFDTTCLRCPNITFIEIDLPDVVLNKAKILIDNQLVVD